MSFKDKKIAVRYRSNENDFAQDFLIPVLQDAVSYKRAVGFFSTSALIDLSVGLFAMAEKGGKVQLICSPKLSEEDIDSINTGYKTRQEVLIGALKVNMTSPLTVYEEERLNLVATMIASGMLDMKLAFMDGPNAINVYHEKVAICEDAEGNKIAFTGSMNESQNAIDGNFESIWPFCSWKEPTKVDVMESDFDRMWIDQTEKLKVIPFPDIIIEKLLTYKRDKVDYGTDAKEFNYREWLKKDSFFKIPDGIELRDYQTRAVDAWFAQHCKGIYSMCTGAGKTITALAAMVKLSDRLNGVLAVFIVCPYIHLVSQWEEDVQQWGERPIIAHSKSPTADWEARLRRACRRFKREKKPFICITTNDTFAGDKVQPLIHSFKIDDPVLLIVDEAHNFGADRLSASLPEQVEYRIALSATIKRHMDRKGTDKLFHYFGSECIVYGLEEAIRDKALVPYEYYPIPVYLEEDELREYSKISKELKKHLISDNGKLRIGESGKFLIYKRTRLLAGARAKIPLLLEKILPYRNSKNILVYCGATRVEDEDTGVEERQIDLITSKLREPPLGMTVQRFTADEGLQERQNIKEYFRSGLVQAVTAIRCLDEGVNIPGIETAFILSSSRNPKEFIQRRGRLLRRSEGKEKAIIFDFITLPRDLDDVIDGDYETDKTIVLGEMARILEFGQLSKNRAVADALLNRIMISYDTFVDIEEEMLKQEEYFDDE